MILAHPRALRKQPFHVTQTVSSGSPERKPIIIQARSRAEAIRIFCRRTK